MPEGNSTEALVPGGFLSPLVPGCQKIRRVEGKDFGADLFFGHRLPSQSCPSCLRGEGGARSRGCTDVPSAWISCPSSWAAWLIPGSSLQTQLTLLPAHCVLAAHSLSSLFPHCVTITGLRGRPLRARRALNHSIQAQWPSGSVC